MRNLQLRKGAALPLLALLGCAGTPGGGSPSVSLTRAGQAVVVTESATRTRYCEFVTDLPVASQSVDDADAVVSLRNAAGAAGGNLLHLVQEARTIARAEAYLCVE